MPQSVELPGFRYDPELGVYINLRTGRPVSLQQMQDLVDERGEQDERWLLALMLMARDGDLAPSVFGRVAANNLHRLHMQNAALGAGGWDNLGNDEIGRIEQAANADVPKLLATVAAVVAGTVSLAMARERIKGYIGNARSQFFRAEREHIKRPSSGQIIIERRMLGIARHCFPAGTMIATPQGERPVEDIRIGDWVTTRFGPRRVTQLFIKYTDDLWQVKANGREVITTGNHPFLTQNGWKRVDALTESDNLMLLENGAYRFERHITLPYPLDSITASPQVSVAGGISDFLLRLPFVQWLKSRVSVPPVTVSFEDQVTNAHVNQEGFLDFDLLLKGYTKSIQNAPQLAFKAARLVLLVGKTPLEQLLLKKVKTFHSSFAAILGVFSGVLSPSIGCRGRVMDDAPVSLLSQSNSEFRSTGTNLAGVYTESCGAPLGPMFGIEPEQECVFSFGPDMALSAEIAPAFSFCTDSFSALFADGCRWLCRSTVGAQLDFAHFGFPARAKIMRLLAPATEHVSGVFTAAYATHNESIIPQGVAVYNFEVEGVHEYVANGFVVHNCSDCVDYYNQGWQLQGTLPPPGVDSVCGSHCRCRIVRRVIPAVEAPLWMNTRRTV